MFFEGSEKKATIIIDPRQLSLLNDFTDDFWHQLVQCADAQILSSISNKNCKAFVLSESSLFIWHDRLLIITCGNTRLVRSVEYFIQQVGKDKIEQVLYQRKNEYFAEAQASTFHDDVQLLSQYVNGATHRFGKLDNHHHYVFHQDDSLHKTSSSHNDSNLTKNKNFQASANDKTYGLSVYQMGKKASDAFTTADISAQQIRTFLQLDTLLDDFLVDDFVFDPFGYSINAIKGSDYLTIHVTPQENGSYVSIESSINLIKLTPIFLSILKPKSFGLLCFNEFDFNGLIEKYIPKKHITNTMGNKQLSNNYLVCFAHYSC